MAFKLPSIHTQRDTFDAIILAFCNMHFDNSNNNEASRLDMPKLIAVERFVGCRFSKFVYMQSSLSLQDGGRKNVFRNVFCIVPFRWKRTNFIEFFMRQYLMLM